MKKTIIILTGCLSIFLAVSSCASINKARNLHVQGENDDALDMAADLVDDSEDQAVRLEAIQLVADIKDQKGGKILLPLLHDEDRLVKLSAIRALGTIRYQEAADGLIALIPDSDPEVVKAIAKSVRELGPESIDRVVKLLFDSKESVKRDKYRLAVIAIGSQSVPFLIKHLEGRTLFENRDVIDLMTKMRDPEVARFLIQQADDPRITESVLQALVSLGRYAEDGILEELSKLKTRNDANRLKEGLIFVLGEIKSKKAVPLLEAYTVDENDPIRQSADLALVKIRGF